MQPQVAYDQLMRRVREQTLLASVAALLGWDEETYLPRAGVGHRASQQALLAGILHQWACDPIIDELLATIEDSDLLADPHSPVAVNVREWRRLHDRSCRLPRTLVEELTRLTSLAQPVWAEAHEKGDGSQLLPWLERIVALKRHETACLGYASHPYDALLEEYDHGLTTEDLLPLLADLGRELVPLVGLLTQAPRRPNVGLLQGDYPVDRQRLLAELTAGLLGFDFQSGRLDVSPHPFICLVGPGDLRITTRFRFNDFCGGFFATLHELGHALYEQGLPPEHYGTPVGEAGSVSVHESQARLWENNVGRSWAFWKYLFPLARQFFPGALGSVDLEEFHFAINNVACTFNRVTADEVTYNLHILQRFEIERDLVDGTLAVRDLPAAWNEGYRRYLGLLPDNDRDGWLQDGHWAAGLFGYFPTYALGNLYAAQLFARARQDLPELLDAFTRGDFLALLGWLRYHVHQHGHRYQARELVQRATGTPPTSRFFLDYLREKYGELYGI